MINVSLPVLSSKPLPETTAEFFGEGRTPPIRSSPLSTASECRRKFLYVYKWGIQPKMLERALTMGSFVHTILQALFMDKAEQDAMTEAEAFLKRHREELIGWTDKAGFLPNGADLKGTLSDLEEDYHKARAMAICFWRFRPFDTKKWEILKDPDGNLMVERILEIDIEGLDMTARVPCDLVLKHKETGEVWIVDFKTTSFEPQVRAASTKFSPQLALYRWVLQSHLDEWGRGEKVAGSFHAIIRKPTIKYCPDTKDKGGFHCYIERLVKWYADAEEKDPTNPPMVLDANRFSGPLCSAELRERLTEYADLAHADPEEELHKFPRAGEYTCMKFNRACPYIHLCNSDPSMWPLIVKDHYEIKWREDEEDLGAAD